MPFTFSHAAAVLPFQKSKLFSKFLPLLVIGSMSPDFEYFLTFKFIDTHGHSLWGILYFCIPTSLVVFYIYEYVMRPKLATFFLRETCPPYNPLRDVPTLVFGLVAIAIGAFSHIAWDSFTHPGGWVVNQYPILFTKTFAAIPLYDMLQQISTLVGGVIVLAFLYRLLKNKKIYIFQRLSFLIALIFFILIIISVTLSGFFQTAGIFAVYAISLLWCATLLACLAIRSSN